jgi:hypothetical protein
MRTGFLGLCVVALVSLLAACSQPADETPPADDAATSSDTAATDDSAATGDTGDAMAGGDVGIPSGERGGMCGGIAAIQCIDAADYCMMETGQCSMPDASGVCTQKPEVCTEDMAPVCGCDGQTYSNACKAAAAGVSVAAEGECVAG